MFCSKYKDNNGWAFQIFCVIRPSLDHQLLASWLRISNIRHKAKRSFLKFDMIRY